MTLPISIALPAQLILIGGAVLMAVWVRAPWVSIAGLGLLAGAVVAARWTQKKGTVAVWVFSVLIWAGCLATNIWDVYFAILAAMIAAALWIKGPTHWESAAMTWSLLAGLLCAGAAYGQNAQGMFDFGFATTVALLIFLRARFNLSPFGVQLVHTFLLVLVGLPIANFFVRPSSRVVPGLDTYWKYYSYEGAKGDPSAFARWWQYYLDETDRAGKIIFELLPGTPRLRLRPRSHTMLFQSAVSINGQGFRGPEISPAKGDTYRIVALGESTTFGITMRPGDESWPELLQQMIRERLKSNRPVEVINAGFPGCSLDDNLARLPGQILALHPDMIISYHGFNGFRFISPAIPQPSGPPPPRYRERPLDLLADGEYRLKMMLFRHGYARKRAAENVAPLQPLETPYAALYRQLIQFSETNGIRLVLADFCMAVNRRSDPEVIEFYRSVFPVIYGQIAANEIHSALLRELAAPHPDVCLVDTHRRLDGEHGKFIDVVHFTQEGRRQLAENIFAGLRDVLEKDLQKMPGTKALPREK